jgi:hypothetical protein
VAPSKRIGAPLSSPNPKQPKPATVARVPAKPARAAAAEPVSAQKATTSGSGLGKRAPKSQRELVDVTTYLQMDGKDVLDKKMECIEQKFKDEVFESTNISEEHFAAVQKKLKPLCQELRSLHGNAISVQWKIKKRSNPPEEALASMQTFRDLVNSIWSLCLAFNKMDPDAMRLKPVLDALRDAEWDVPKQFQVRCYLVRGADFCHMGAFQEFVDLIDVRNSVNLVWMETSERVNMNMHMVEHGTLKLLSAAAQAEDTMAGIMKVVVALRLLLTLQASQVCPLTADFMKGLPWLITALDCEKTTSDADQQQAWQHLQAPDGVDPFAFFTGSGTFGAIKDIIAEVIKAKQKKASKNNPHGPRSADQ